MASSSTPALLKSWHCASGRSDRRGRSWKLCRCPGSRAHSPHLLHFQGSHCSYCECGPLPLILTHFRPGLQAWGSSQISTSLVGVLLLFPYLHFNKTVWDQKATNKNCLMI